MDNEVLQLLKELKAGQEELQQNQKELQQSQEETNKKLSNIESAIKEFKDQFTDFEGKVSINHRETVNKLNSLQKDVNTMEIITSKNWNDIALFKSNHQ